MSAPRARRPTGPVLILLVLALAGPLPAWGQGTGRGATLFVASSPMRATILLDGAPVGTETPALLRDLAPGRHTVLLRKPGFAAIREEIDLVAGAPRAISCTLVPSGVEIAAVGGWAGLPGAEGGESSVLGLPPGLYGLGRDGLLVTIRPVYPGEALIRGLDIVTPLALALGALSTLQDLLYAQGSAHLFSPLTLTSYAISVGAIGLEIALRVERTRWTRSFRFEPRGVRPSEDEPQLLDRAESLLGQGRLDEALGALLRHIESFPESRSVPSSLYQIAKIYQLQGQSLMAIATLRLLIDAYPDPELYDRAVKSLADAQVASGEYAAALASLERMVMIDPLYTPEEIQAYRGGVLALWGEQDASRLPEAVAAYRGLLASFAGSPRLAEYRYLLAESLYRAGQSQEAAFELSRSREGADEELLERIGELERELGGAE